MHTTNLFLIVTHKHTLKAKKKKKKVDDDEDEDDSDLDSDSESLETQRKKFYAWRAPPEPDEGDLITFASEPQFNFEPNEEINQKVSLWQGDSTNCHLYANNEATITHEITRKLQLLLWRWML